jgi:hypothetical protein
MAKALLAEKVEHGLRRRQQFLVEASHRIPLPHHRKPHDVKHDETAVLQLARVENCSISIRVPEPRSRVMKVSTITTPSLSFSPSAASGLRLAQTAPRLHFWIVD